MGQTPRTGRKTAKRIHDQFALSNNNRFAHRGRRHYYLFSKHIRRNPLFSA